MDKIKLNLIIKEKNFFDVEVFLNEEKIQHNIFNTITAIAVSQIDCAEFDLFTCTCGVSGCAGFQSPMHQSKTIKTVSWLFSEDYKANKKLYVFNRQEFEDEFSKLMKEVTKLDENNIYSMSSYEFFTDKAYKSNNKKSLPSFNNVIEKTVEIFKLKQKFSTVCKEHIPFFTNVYFEYEGYKATVSASDLVCMILNEWPRFDTKFYWGRVVLACNAVNKYIINNDETDIIYLDSRSYWDLYEIEPKYIFNFIHRLTFNKTIDTNIKTIYFEDEFIVMDGVESPYPEKFSINTFKVSY